MREERSSARIDRLPDRCPDDEDVVCDLLELLHRADHLSRRAREERHAVLDAKLDTRESLLARAVGESLAELSLRGGEDADAEEVGVADCLERAAVLAQRDREERRLDRERHQRDDGAPDRSSRACRRDDGDSRRPVTHELPKIGLWNGRKERGGRHS